MGTMFVPSRTLLSHFGDWNWGYLVFGRKEPGAQIVTIATTLRVKFVFFVMDIYGAKFQDHCFNISRDIVYSVFTTFQLQ